MLAVVGVSEVHVPIRLENHIIRTIQSLTVVVSSQRLETPIILQSGNLSITVLRQHQVSLSVKSQPIRTDFTGSRHLSRIPRRSQEHIHLAILPLHHSVVSHVGEDQVIFEGQPERSFSPAEATGKFCDLR